MVDITITESVVVQIGDVVTVSYPADGETLLLTIVSAGREAPGEGETSVESPLGSALLGAKVGDVLQIRIGPQVTEVVLDAIADRTPKLWT